MKSIEIKSLIVKKFQLKIGKMNLKIFLLGKIHLFLQRLF